jgi:predicted methyltransferase
VFGLLIHSEVATVVCRAPIGSTQVVSFDLGRSTESVVRTADGIRWKETMLPLDPFRRVASAGNTIYLLDLSTLSMIPLQRVHDAKLYQLRCTRTAPTVMISGIQMHCLDNAWEDSLAKSTLVVRPGDWVLDTCGGLLYTALASLEIGAGLVVTTEPDAAIRWLRAVNPWSALSSNMPILSFEIQCQDLIARLPDHAMDCVLHDPPRFSLAGDLYGQRFYSTLHRVLRPGGKLYHYTGLPYSKGRGRRFVKGVARRLQSAGFEVRWHQESKGLVGRSLR